MKSKEKLSLQVDLAFKALLGRGTLESNILLTDLINSILKPPIGELITSVKILNPFNVQQHPDDKLTILDIKAETNSGELVDIEMQMNYTSIFRNRSVYYWSKLHASQLLEGQSFECLKKSICIIIISEQCFTENNRSHNVFGIREHHDGFALCDDLEIHYVQLPLIDDTIEVDGMDPLTKWMVFIKDMHLAEKESIINEIVSEEGVMQLAYEEYSKINADDLLREQLEARQKFIWDVTTEKSLAKKEARIAGLEEGRKEGREEGRKVGKEEGRKEGVEEGKIEVARELLNILDDKKISEATGLDLEVIKNLRT